MIAQRPTYSIHWLLLASMLIHGVVTPTNAIAAASEGDAVVTINQDSQGEGQAEVLGDGLILSPANLLIDELEPGDRFTGNVTLANRTGNPITLDLSLGEVVGSADPEDIVEIRHGVRSGVAGWVELERDDITVPGDGRLVDVGFSGTVPPDADSGDVAFAISATAAPSADGEQQGGAVLATRLVSIFAIALPGEGRIGVEITRAELSDTFWAHGQPPVTAVVAYENTGTRFVRPQGYIVAESGFPISKTIRYEVPKATLYPDGANLQAVELG